MKEPKLKFKIGQIVWAFCDSFGNPTPLIRGQISSIVRDDDHDITAFNEGYVTLHGWSNHFNFKNIGTSYRKVKKKYDAFKSMMLL